MKRLAFVLLLAGMTTTATAFEQKVVVEGDTVKVFSQSTDHAMGEAVLAAALHPGKKVHIVVGPYPEPTPREMLSLALRGEVGPEPTIRGTEKVSEAYHRLAWRWKDKVPLPDDPAPDSADGKMAELRAHLDAMDKAIGVDMSALDVHNRMWRILWADRLAGFLSRHGRMSVVFLPPEE